MRILYILSGTNSNEGSAKSFISMINELKRKGNDILVVCPNDKDFYNVLKNEDIPVKAVPYSFAALPPHKRFKDKVRFIQRYLERRKRNNKSLPILENIVEEFHPDIIHENNSVINVGYRVSKLMNIPYIVHIREYGLKDFGLIIPGLTKRLKDPAVHSIAITKDIARFREVDSNPNSIQLYDGIIPNDGYRYTSEKDNYFLFVGRIQLAKGIKELIIAYGEYVRKASNIIPLKIVGATSEPNLLKELRDYATANGFIQYLEFLGVRNDVADLTYKALATIIPSRNEGLGRVMPEAMANGSLCIGKNTGGTKEQMENGKELIDSPVALSFITEAELAGIMCSISDNKNLAALFKAGGIYHEMIANSQKTVKYFFSEEDYGNKMLSFYKKVLNEK